MSFKCTICVESLLKVEAKEADCIVFFNEDGSCKTCGKFMGEHHRETKQLHLCSLYVEDIMGCANIHFNVDKQTGKCNSCKRYPGQHPSKRDLQTTTISGTESILGKRKVDEVAESTVKGFVGGNNLTVTSVNSYRTIKSVIDEVPSFTKEKTTISLLSNPPSLGSSPKEKRTISLLSNPSSVVSTPTTAQGFRDLSIGNNAIKASFNRKQVNTTSIQSNTLLTFNFAVLYWREHAEKGVLLPCNVMSNNKSVESLDNSCSRIAKLVQEGNGYYNNNNNDVKIDLTKNIFAQVEAYIPNFTYATQCGKLIHLLKKVGANELRRTEVNNSRKPTLEQLKQLDIRGKGIYFEVEQYSSKAITQFQSRKYSIAGERIDFLEIDEMSSISNSVNEVLEPITTDQVEAVFESSSKIQTGDDLAESVNDSNTEKSSSGGITRRGRR